MNEPAIVTVKITLLGENETIVIVGPPNQATDMPSKLAAAMNVSIGTLAQK
jgi:hypothetical protein